MLSQADAKELLKLARDSIKEEFGEQTEISDKLKKKFSGKRGVFVTLYKDGELRGCIGIPVPVEELWKAVYTSAKNAAFSDPRFAPLQKEELKDIKIALSVLTVPEEIKCKKEELIKNIEVGKDGLIVEQGYAKGLLLPQVAPEFGWNSLELLQHTCGKAGLSTDAWKESDCKVFKFQAEVFKE